jgi:hypothetical protein
MNFAIGFNLLSLFIFAASQQQVVAQIQKILGTLKKAGCAVLVPSHLEIMMCMHGNQYGAYSSSPRLNIVCNACLPSKQI